MCGALLNGASTDASATRFEAVGCGGPAVSVKFTAFFQIIKKKRVNRDMQVYRSKSPPKRLECLE